MTPDRRTLFAGSATIAAAMALPAAAQQAAAPAPAAAGQAPGFYKFKVGGLTVTTVHDGIARRPVEGFVRNAPLADVQAVLAESFLPTDSFTIPFTLTVVDTGRHLVVFDSGNGVPAAGATNGRAIENLRAAGIDRDRVNVVAMSHFHGDHIGGLLNAEGGRAFPNAEVMVPETEWRWWTDEGNQSRSPESQRATFANTARRFAPYQGKVRQIAEGTEIVPGIRSVSIFGHTPGHTGYHIADGDAQMMYLADITNRPELLARRPDFHAAFDFDPEVAEASRRRMFDRVVSDRVRVTGYHFPFPANGFMTKDGAGYRFVPADWSSAV